jgi:hypothetical protein
MEPEPCHDSINTPVRERGVEAFKRAECSPTAGREILSKLGARLIEKVPAEECEQGGYGRRICVEKHGYGVNPSETIAMKQVEEHTNVPTAKLLDSFFSGNEGQIVMTYIPGLNLEAAWPSMDDGRKAKICNSLWEMVAELRSVPRPPELSDHFLCLADGSPSPDVLIRNFEDTRNALATDDDVRTRIIERYQYFGGHQYAKILPDMLPRSTRSVFTHADIAPRNIIVNSEGEIAALLDWERAGWYPEYWELARIIGPSSDFEDFQEWMVKLCPQGYRYDLQGIQAARIVLF